MREITMDNASMGGMRQTGEQEGIKLHTSVRYSPKSNGVPERMIGVLMNAVRAMVRNSGLPQVIWAETYNCAHNRTPTRVLGGRTRCSMACCICWSAVRHCRAEGTERPCVTLRVASTTEAVIGSGTGKDELSPSPKKLIFFEDGLTSPTLNDLPPWPVDEDGSVTQPVLDHSIKPTTPPDTANAPTLSRLCAATPTSLPEVTHQPVSALRASSYAHPGAG